MPHHWTKINDESTVAPGDDLYEDEATGTLYVRGQVGGNTTVDEIAAKYHVQPENVTFPLKKKR